MTTSSSTIHRSDEAVFIQVFLRHGRGTAMKQNFYRRVAEKLTVNPGLPANDVLIVLTENGLDDWSFGQGRAQYVENPPRPLTTGTTAAPGPDRPAAAVTVAKSAAGVFTGGLVMLGLVALLHLVSPLRLETALANAFPTDDPVAMASFTG